jgi:aminobenzoyl-glutamate utilization protein B
MVDVRQDKEFVWAWIDNHHEPFYTCADTLWRYAELGCEEFLSSKLLIRMLEENGFDVRAGVALMPTAFVAQWGEGHPVIAFNCEYDSLPGLSQKAGKLDERPAEAPLIEGAPGHGCGHNVLGTGLVMSALAVKTWLEKNTIAGTVKVFGTPAEEICVGKPFMAREGLFEGVDAVLDWHPWSHNSANSDTCNAYFNIKYHFKGRTAHGNAPWMGRSALDSAVLMAHAVELLREHIPPGRIEAANTINYTFSDVGPDYPSVVPDRSTLWVVGRISDSKLMLEIIERINRCAEGASLCTGTAWEKEIITATHEKIPNNTLSRVLYENFKRVGPPRFNAAEQRFAKAMQAGVDTDSNGLSEEILDFQESASLVTDNSEYSWFAPFAMIWVTLAPAGIGWHNWQVTAVSGTSIAKKAMITAAKVLAGAFIDLVLQPEILPRAKKELTDRLEGRTYTPIIPSDASPPVDFNQKTMERFRPLMERHYDENSDLEVIDSHRDEGGDND